MSFYLFSLFTYIYYVLLPLIITVQVVITCWVIDMIVIFKKKNSLFPWLYCLFIIQIDLYNICLLYTSSLRYILYSWVILFLHNFFFVLWKCSSSTRETTFSLHKETHQDNTINQCKMFYDTNGSRQRELYVTDNGQSWNFYGNSLSAPSKWNYSMVVFYHILKWNTVVYYLVTGIPVCAWLFFARSYRNLIFLSSS